jgi:hypothetical protein
MILVPFQFMISIFVRPFLSLVIHNRIGHLSTGWHSMHSESFTHSVKLFSVSHPTSVRKDLVKV